MSLRVLARALPLLAVVLASACTRVDRQQERAAQQGRAGLRPDVHRHGGHRADGADHRAGDRRAGSEASPTRSCSSACSRGARRQPGDGHDGSRGTRADRGDARHDGRSRRRARHGERDHGLRAGDGVAIPGSLARLVLLPKPLVLRAVGDTARLVANLADQFGNPLPSSAITWRSLDESIATVDAAGLVTARRLAASTQVIASTASGISDTVTVSVADPNASVCASAAVTLQPGQSIVADQRRRARASVRTSPRSTSPCRTSRRRPARTRRTSCGCSAAGSRHSPAFSGSVGGILGIGPSCRSRPPARSRRGRSSRHCAPPSCASCRAASPAGRGAARPGERARRSAVIPNTLGVGDIVTLNASGTSACDSPINREGRVAAISQKAVIIHDQSNPTGGFDDADYARIAATFDTLVVPVNGGPRSARPATWTRTAGR